MVLESPTNGVMDISLIPSFFFDKMSFNSASSGITGPGAISGVIELSNVLIDKPITSLELSGSTLQNSFVGLSHQGKIGESASRTRVFAEYNKNAFNYANFQEQRVEFPPSIREGVGIMQENKGSFGKWKVKNSIWFQYNKREIPPTILQIFFKRLSPQQTDRNLRIATSFKRSFDKYSLNIRSGYSSEYLLYQDDFGSINDAYHNQTANLLLRAHRELTNNLLLSLFLEDRLTTSRASSYYTNARNEFSPSLLLKYSKTNVKAVASLRRSFYLNKTSPFLPALQLSWEKGTHLLSLSGSKNYRLPSMNDLFWTPGGRLDLEPEGSTRAELSWKAEMGKFNLKTAVFYHKIEKQIKWLPGPRGFFETTQNSLNAWNRGIEASLNYRDSLGLYVIKAFSNVQFLKSTMSESVPGLLEGRQQIYVPKYLAKIGMSIKAPSKTTFAINCRWNSQRYLLSDLSDSIPSFFLCDISITQRMREQWIIKIEVSNLFDEDYYILPFRPLPGTNATLSMKYKLNRSSKKRNSKT